MSVLKFFAAGILILSSHLAIAQQNAGPLNAAPGVPNQNPMQPNIASKVTVNPRGKYAKASDPAVQACNKLPEGAACEMKGINTKKIKGECRQQWIDDSTLVCKAK